MAKRGRSDLTLALLAVACGAACSRSAPSAESAAAAGSPLAVKVAAVQARTTDRTVDLVGELRAAQEVTLAAEVEGRLQQVTFDLGDRVHAGEIMARIDPELLGASLRQAEARLASAEDDWRRIGKLQAEGITSPAEAMRARTARDAAHAEHDLARIRLERATVRAPIAGAVSARAVDAGDYARVGAPLFTIVADETLRLRAEVAERFVPEIATGQEVRGEVDAFPGLTVRGHVARVNAALDAQKRSLVVEAEIDNRNGRLRPGFFVRGVVVTQSGVTAVTVPSGAVSSFAGVTHVFVVDGGVARSREVQIGGRFEDEVELVSGAAAGERVIVSGLGRIHDGTPVVAEQGS